MKRLLVLAAMLFVMAQAKSHEHVVAKVGLVESSYMPASVAFILASGTASCPAGKWLFWQRDAENNKAVYAMLLAAKISGGSVRIFFDEGDSTCVPRHLHLVD